MLRALAQRLLEIAEQSVRDFCATGIAAAFRDVAISDRRRAEASLRLVPSPLWRIFRPRDSIDPETDENDGASDRGMIIMLLHFLVIVGVVIYFMNR